jgi:hypothetical protein
MELGPQNSANQPRSRKPPGFTFLLLLILFASPIVWLSWPQRNNSIQQVYTDPPDSSCLWWRQQVKINCVTTKTDKCEYWQTQAKLCANSAQHQHLNQDGIEDYRRAGLLDEEKAEALKRSNKPDQ